MKIARFDVKQFYDDMNIVRESRDMTWTDVATQSGVSASTLTRIGQGRRPDVDSLAALLVWSNLSPSRYFIGPPAP